MTTYQIQIQTFGETVCDNSQLNKPCVSIENNMYKECTFLKLQKNNSWPKMIDQHI